MVIIGMNIEFVWPAMCLIAESAFNPQAAFGGPLGGIMAVIQFG
ncbi:MAG: hypothetical protein ACLT98_04760 [Eggerthellaceae bacterium]